MFRFMPEAASEIAPEVDKINYWILDLSLFFTVVIVGAMIYFAIRYKQKGDAPHETPRIEGNNILEVIWTVVPTIICIFIAYYGIAVYGKMRAVPTDAMEVNVTASSWKWDFEYANGKKTTHEAYIPVDKPVKFLLTSKDVLHSFFVPSMRVKSDAVPGMYTYVTFKPIKTGDYQIFCTEYCGKDHSAMLAKLHVLPQEEFEKWLEDRSVEEAQAAMSPAKLGATLYTQKGCNACHSLDGSRVVGPSFLKIFGRKGKLDDGTEYVADENYIKNSILNPMSQIVEGYVGQMPSFEGQLSDDEIGGIIAFMKTLDGSAPVEEAAPAEEEKVDLSKLSPEERGELLYKSKTCFTCHSLDGTGAAEGKLGPTWKGLYGRKGKFNDGTEYVADDAYITGAIKNPTQNIVEGYNPVMPQLGLTDDEISDVIAFIKAQKE